MFLLEGPIESDYSLAIVNRQLAYGLLAIGEEVQLHQRDNTTAYAPTPQFSSDHPLLASRVVSKPLVADIHSRYIYPPHTDGMRGAISAVHCYGWEESVFPAQYVQWFNRDLDLITVMSEYVRTVLKTNGVDIPIVNVGLGADHILGSPAQPIPATEGHFTFLHVSSCFPRKAPDVLVQAFCEEFLADEPVRLVVKTFDNPHNEIADIVRRADAAFPRHAPIEVLWQPLNAGQMRFLYEHAGCLVAPSRGEGFGLPVAEAMLVGCPVIATPHGGHVDICLPDTFWPVDFRLEHAATHLTEQQSYWAEPAVSSLRKQMRAVTECDSEVKRRRTEKAREHVDKHFQWRFVAERHRDACDEIKRNRVTPRSQPLNIAFISSWNTQCGIAEYTRYLATELAHTEKVSIFAAHADDRVRPDEDFVVRSWTLRADAREIGDLLHQLIEAEVDVVSIQFNFAFFIPESFTSLVHGLKKAGVKVFVTLHSTHNDEHLARMFPALVEADSCIVHREADLEKLVKLGVQNSVIQRQGIFVPEGGRDRGSLPCDNDSFIIASFGFFLPPKGIYELIQAFDLISRVNPNARLVLLNALYPLKESHEYAAACLNLIRARGLASRIEIHTSFLPQSTILDELSAADLIVLPYTHSTESSSAAIRLPLASLTPILCSDLAIFDEFGDIIHRFQSNDVFALANKILSLSADRAELNKYAAAQKAYVEDLAWDKAAARFLRLIKQHVGPHRESSLLVGSL